MKKPTQRAYPWYAKKNCVASLLLFLMGVSAWAQYPQSQLWTMPPKYSKFNLTGIQAQASLPVISGGYAGGVSNNPSNAYYDASGNLLVFVVDGSIYDGSGRKYGDITISSTGAKLSGTTEFIIVPVPGNCKQFYLIGGLYTGSCSTGGYPLAFYTTLDLNRAYTNLTGTGGTGSAAPAMGDLTSANAVPLSGGFNYAMHNGALHFAVTTPLAYTSSSTSYNRLLFISYSGGICSYNVTSSGITASASPAILFPNYTLSNGGRNELEVVPFNGGYRLAAAYTSASMVNTVFVTNVDITGTQISTAAPNTYTFAVPNNGAVKGLELTSGGKILYVTHASYPYLEYINLTPAGLVFVPIAGVSNPSDFQNSQIELGYDGYMYFYCSGTPNRLAYLSSPNSGGSSGWTDPQTANYLVTASTGKGCDPTVLSDWLYLLPDQNDDDVYSNLWQSVTVSPNPANICSGSCATLSYTSTNNDPVQVTYMFGSPFPYLHGPYTYTAGNFGSWCPAATQTYSAIPVIPAGSGYCPSTTLITINVTTNIPSFNLSDVTSNCSYATLSAVANNVATTSSHGYGFEYIVEELNASGSTVWIENNNPCYWWNFPYPTDFNGISNYVTDYSGTVNLWTSCVNSAHTKTCTPTTGQGTEFYQAGQFKYGNTYRITLGSWNTGCAWAQSSQTITPASGCREANGLTKSIIGDDYNAPDFSYLRNQEPTSGFDQNKEAIEGAVSSFKIYPNPNNGMFSMESDAYSPNTPVEITDMMGRVVWSQSFTDLAHRQVDLSNVESGVYFIKVRTGNTFSEQKIIKQ